MLPDGQIRVRVHAIVNGVDFGNSTLRSGYLVPAVTTRQVNKLIDVKPGQTFVITGLINQQTMTRLQAVPEVAQHHLIQTFADQRSRKPNTDLIVLITPEVLEEPQAD